MADFIPLDTGDVTGELPPSTISAKSHFHSIHPEVELLPHQCVCGRYFKELKNMRSHQKATGHGACVCGENFSTYPELHRHRYEGVHFVRCTCDKIFGSTQHLLSHQRLEEHLGYRDTKKGPLKKIAMESDTLNEVVCPCGHQMLDDNSGATLHCECGRAFQDAYGPARDSYHPNTTVFSCCNCATTYDTWDEMWHHQLFIHHPCIACHKIFICETRLMLHQHETKHCYCPDCDEHFMTPDRLRQHLLEIHHVSRAEVFRDALDERPLDAPTTPATSFGDPPVYKGGFKSGRNFLHINLRCRICGHDFTSPKTLHAHRTRGWHDPFTSINCPFSSSTAAAAACCNTNDSFPSISALLHHLETAQCGSGITLADLNAALRGGELEHFILPENHLRATPQSPCAALSDREIQALCDQQQQVTAAAAVAAAADTNAMDRRTTTTNEKTKLTCPFCLPPPSSTPSAVPAPTAAPAAAVAAAARKPKTFPTTAQLKAHLISYNHTPRFLRYPDFIALPPTKSRTKAAGFGAWSGLAHSLETLLCAGEVEGVQRALDAVEGRLRALGVGEEADIMVD